MRRPGRNATRGGLALLAGAGLAAGVSAVEPEAETTRAIMGEVYGALRRVLPASLDGERFAAPERRAEIERSLDTLARHAERLAAHGADSEQGFVFLSRSLARDARDLERRFDAGHPSEARFLLLSITETCAACHSRLPDPDDAALSAAFLDDEAVVALPLPEQATLAMATRQFERALAAFEAMFRDPDYDAPSTDLSGYLEDYLEVSLRVKGDPARAARTLEAFARREDVRPGLRSAVERWVRDLRQVAAGGPVEGLERARETVLLAEAVTPHLGERAELVRYVTASGALHRLLATIDSSDPRAGEACYWLGVIESRIGRSFWLSQTEAYFEAAIRLAPDRPLAEDAYAALEEFVVLGYTGSSGEHVPEDVRRWLEELARLIERSRTGDES